MIRALLFMLLFMGLACKSQEKSNVNDNTDSVKSLQPTLLLSDNYGGSEDADFQVIRDKKKLILFFAQVNKTRKPGLPVPDVDFSKEIVILYCPGKRMNGGTPKLTIKENTTERIVFGLDDSEIEQKAGIEALTMPFSLYKLPLTEREIILQKE